MAISLYTRLAQIDNARGLAELLNDLEVAPIGIMGGRKFSVMTGDVQDENRGCIGRISLKEIIKKAQTLDPSKEKHDFHHVVSHIKSLNDNGDLILKMSSLWRRIMTAICRFFGNVLTCFNPQNAIERLDYQTIYTIGNRDVIKGEQVQRRGSAAISKEESEKYRPSISLNINLGDLKKYKKVALLDPRDVRLYTRTAIHHDRRLISDQTQRVLDTIGAVLVDGTHSNIVKQQTGYGDDNFFGIVTAAKLNSISEIREALTNSKLTTISEENAKEKQYAEIDGATYLLYSDAVPLIVRHFALYALYQFVRIVASPVPHSLIEALYPYSLLFERVIVNNLSKADDFVSFLTSDDKKDDERAKSYCRFIEECRKDPNKYSHMLDISI